MLGKFCLCRPCHRLSRLQISFFRLYSINRANFYTVLGVGPAADSKEIKDKFYELSKKFHPDHNKDDPDKLYKFKAIAEAYEVLSNTESKKLYDQQNGFNIIRKNPSIRTRNFRRFEGMKGSFQNGRFVDDEAPPEMRNIQYDLSQEKMEKIWARYKERWDKTEEIERMRELDERKAQFRKKLDERRANIQNMSPQERENFLFQMRMMMPEAHIKPQLNACHSCSRVVRVRRAGRKGTGATCCRASGFARRALYGSAEDHRRQCRGY